ncbi:galactokinase [Haploplasma axanthum]|uniref:Galactokinase n=1 Tax=Haploplasma axanthum TaxID=29552 RepID=A0A449BEM8_HAPAX|nr:galactokinase [Haploplasma axanthum]VEU80885.1 Galactokinase [Haploplasma axanthum]
MKNSLKENFTKIFGIKPEKVYFSPGRVNLIGEHIDYNGGFVMPCALSYGTYGVISLRSDNLVRVYSEGFTDEIYEFEINDITKDSKNSWADYVKGVFSVMKNRKYKIDHGFNLYLYNTMPTNAGLSSSASLESLIVYILNDIFDLNIDITNMALIGKESENNFVGVNSGIMDQFAIVAGKKEHAILLNTQTLDYKYIPLILNDYSLLVINTNKKRGLADSKYNERFNECQESLEILKKHYDVKDLCSISVNELPKIKKLLSPILYKRVKHVITEQDRTIKSAQALKDNKIIEFAEYLNESHKSLQYDYEVTGIELDTLVNETIKAGAIGARMTGAGFGGCIVAIIKSKDIDNLIPKVKTNYTNLIGYEPSFYVVTPSDGPIEL